MNLSFVICGVEHSGTTLLSDIYRQVGGLDSGFECGVLLCRSPRTFPDLQPYFANMERGWGISENDLRSCCETQKFSEFYACLAEKSKALEAGVTAIFDKTPRYFSRLSECLSRVTVPFVCTYKDPRAIVYSDMVRAKPTSFQDWYETYVPTKMEYLSRIYAEATRRSDERQQRVLIISLEDICLNAQRTLERAFSHVGFRFQPHYVAIRKRRYAHNRDDSIRARIPFEYRTGLSPGQITAIEGDFAPLTNWFYD